MPTVVDGFTVKKFADGFENPRWIYQGPNGDLFICESSTTANSANRITIMQDKDKDGTYDTKEILISNLNKPFGMLILNEHFYVANTDALMKYPYKEGETAITETGKKILDLPAGGYNNHWTRNIIPSGDGTKIYVSVGSASNVAEHGMDKEERRANILEINPDGSGEKIYAFGLRNPVAMEFYPGTTTLWTAVNERDGLGDNLVPDYMTSVKEGGFYGWPYAYWGQHIDPRLKGEGTDLVKKTIVPDVNLGSHTASLGMTFYDKEKFPEKYQGGAFVGQHGSWNRSEFSGYKVVFVPFENGKPTGKPEDFLTGFIADPKKGKVYGRPVGVTVLQDGSILVADDAGNTIWQVTATTK
jgi:glucose/arabinose dehydrogenase